MSFFHSENRTTRGQATPRSAAALHKAECVACPLNHAANATPKMRPSGADKPIIYILGEAPGQTEDRKGEPFVGRSGKLLRANIPRKWAKHCRFNNVIRDRPPDNRNPDWVEIECCRPSIVRDIERTKPKAIFGFGGVPLKWATGQDTISRWRGRPMPAKIGNHICWYFPFYHPSWLLRQRKETRRGDTIKSNAERVWETDLKRAFANCAALPEPCYEDPARYYDGCRYVLGFRGDKDIKKVERWLNELIDEPYLAVDIETTSDEPRDLTHRRVRPYGRGARLLSFGIGTGRKSYSIPLWHEGNGWTDNQIKRVEKILINFLLEHKGIKIAQKADFEMEWLATLYDKKLLRDVKWHCTLAQAYVLDARRGALNLDALIQRWFGFNLKAVSNVDPNNLDLYPIEDVLKYNVLDVKYEYKLYFQQMSEIENKQLGYVVEEQYRRLPTIVMTQMVGLDVDHKQVQKTGDRLEKEINELHDSVRQEKVVQKFIREHGEFNPGSVKDLAVLFGDYLGYDLLNDKGKISTDKHILSKIDHPLAKTITEWRERTKLKNTYCDGFIYPDGKFIYDDEKLHPGFKSAHVLTRRLACEDPNGQNFPKRSSKWIRQQITAPEGHIFTSVDYGQMEARVIGMASRDKFLCKALWERYDIHGEWAERVAAAYPQRIGGKKFAKDKQVMKGLRDDVKGGLVFAAFFGAHYTTIARQIQVPDKIADRLLRDFWHQFPDVKGWQETLHENYEEFGYVELLTGFRRHGPLKSNEIINTPIQGTASDIVVDGMNRISEYAYEHNDWTLQPRLNIHDDLSFCLRESTFDDDLALIIYKMLDCRFEFINVPLLVEVVAGPNWYEQKDIGKFYSDEYID